MFCALLRTVPRPATVSLVRTSGVRPTLLASAGVPAAERLLARREFSHHEASPADTTASHKEKKSTASTKARASTGAVAKSANSTNNAAAAAGNCNESVVAKEAVEVLRSMKGMIERLEDQVEKQLVTGCSEATPLHTFGLNENQTHLRTPRLSEQLTDEKFGEIARQASYSVWERALSNDMPASLNDETDYSNGTRIELHRQLYLQHPERFQLRRRRQLNDYTNFE